MAIVNGEKITLKATFTNDAGTATDPGTPVLVSVRKPDGTLDVDEQTATKDSTGVFTYSYTTSAAGTHNYQFKSSDGAIEEDSFYANKEKA